ncbi:MAG: NAD(P)-binding protein, partial [Cycloclasticus sp.]|nr:NAD(P)-binding protein [Cycloclasticus sp.]MBQ0789563.1 NAD(P)-binding protein [Cycloclasticus sp.]
MSNQDNHSAQVKADFDAVIVGAGFGGMYMTHKLRNEQGLRVQCYDNGSDVGGTWYWNRYP